MQYVVGRPSDGSSCAPGHAPATPCIARIIAAPFDDASWDTHCRSPGRHVTQDDSIRSDTNTRANENGPDKLSTRTDIHIIPYCRGTATLPVNAIGAQGDLVEHPHPIADHCVMVDHDTIPAVREVKASADPSVWSDLSSAQDAHEGKIRHTIREPEDEPSWLSTNISLYPMAHAIGEDDHRIREALICRKITRYCSKHIPTFRQSLL